MKDIIDFLVELRENNHKPWFDANKKRYKQIQAEFNDFTMKLIEGIESFDPSVKGLTIRECTYRIYRDTRFSKDKTPYKTHMGAYICPKGKKSGYAGYYFHVEPQGTNTMLGGHLLTGGLYMPEPVVLRSLRDEIYDNGEELLKAVKSANGFELNQSNKLKRLPAGFPAGTDFEEYLKLKDFYITKKVDDDYLFAPDLVERAVQDFKSTFPLVSILNRAVDYAYEEMM